MANMGDLVRGPYRRGRIIKPRIPMRRAVPQEQEVPLPTELRNIEQAKIAKPAQPPNQRTNPIVVYMEQSNECFRKVVQQPISTICADIRDLRNYIATSSDIKEKHPHMSDKLMSIDDKVWKLQSKIKPLHRRLLNQVEKVKKKTAQTPRWTNSKPKSVARQNAGKIKAAALAERNKAFKDAVESLKAEGYKGSFKMKRGSPVHSRMMSQLQQAQAASAASASSAVVGPR